MKEASISEFKAQCSALIEQVQRTGRPIRITRFGKPIAEIVPTPAAARRHWIGSMKNEIEILGDIVSSVDAAGIPCKGLGSEIASIFAEVGLDSNIPELRGRKNKP
jgi:prevent-host-death family protein